MDQQSGVCINGVMGSRSLDSYVLIVVYRESCALPGSLSAASKPVEGLLRIEPVSSATQGDNFLL
jgi:hypothetical protein